SCQEVCVPPARSVIDALDSDRYEVETIEIGRDGRWALNSGMKELDRPRAGTPPVAARSPAQHLGRAVVSPRSPIGRSGKAEPSRAFSSSPECRMSARE